MHENTVFSVPSVLDGKMPRAGQEPTVQDHPENLFTLLGDTYEMRVSEEATNLCPARLCERPNDPGGAARLTQLADDASIVYSYLVAPDALRERLPSINDRWRNFRDSEGRGDAVPRNGVLSRLAGGERPQRFRGAVAAMRPGKRPTLDFIHTLLPHEPLEYLPDGQRYRPGVAARPQPRRPAVLPRPLPHRSGLPAPPAPDRVRGPAARRAGRAASAARASGTARWWC